MVSIDSMSSKGKKMAQPRLSLIKFDNEANSGTQVFENKIGEDLLTKKMLAERTHYSVSYIDKLMKHGKIPYLKNGRSVRFIYCDVVAALKKASAA